MGVKISNLPVIVTPELTDIFPVVQAGVTYKETVTQLQTLLGTVGVTTITGTANQVIASAATGPVTLSLPQSIATTSDVTFGSVTFSPTTKGIVGTPTNNNAAAGYVGEFIQSNIASGAGIAMTTATLTNITSISLTAGDWDVWGNIFYTNTGNTTNTYAAINTTSVTLPDSSFQAFESSANSSNRGLVAPYQRMSLSGTTTVYLIGFITIGSGTSTACGTLSARRAR